MAGERELAVWLAWAGTVASQVNANFHMGSYLYEVSYIAMVYFFAYFWTAVQFQPKELANNLRDMGASSPPAARKADRGLPRSRHAADHLRRRRLPGPDRGDPVGRRDAA
jgi:hypothetical protein